MTAFTADPEKMRHDWTKPYLNIMILQSHNPITKHVLDDFKPSLARFNERMSVFLDSLGDAIKVVS